MEYVFGRYKTFQISTQSVIYATDLDFRDLIPYDGFPQFESAHEWPATTVLENLNQIKV